MFPMESSLFLRMFMLLMNHEPPPHPSYLHIYRAALRMKNARALRMKRFLKRQTELRNYFFTALLAEYCSKRSVRNIWVQERSGVWWQHVLVTWKDMEWQSNFRMRKTTFLQLCNILQPHLKKDTTRLRRPVPVEQRVAICLWRFATNVEYRTISHLFGIGLSTACEIANDVASVIVENLLSLYIKTPSQLEIKVIIDGFRDLWGFPQCGGAIDGTHIGILAPSVTPAEYFNREGFYSVILQGVVDHRLRFWDVNVGWPGSVPDARVFKNSTVFHRGQGGTLFPNLTERIMGVDVPVVMLGDAEYPLLPWLMKPYPESGASPAHQTFNSRLGEARTTVERAFGRLKGRWRCLMKRYDCHLEKINTTIIACCILHNYCEVNGEEFDEETFVNRDKETNEWNACHANTAANTTRDALCSYFSTNLE